MTIDLPQHIIDAFEHEPQAVEDFFIAQCAVAGVDAHNPKTWGEDIKVLAESLRTADKHHKITPAAADRFLSKLG